MAKQYTFQFSYKIEIPYNIAHRLFAPFFNNHVDNLIVENRQT